MDQILHKTKDYELLDSGDLEKLERFGNIILSRPDPGALWIKGDRSIWRDADSKYERSGNSGKWYGKLPDEWNINFGNLNFVIRPTSFKHVGLFPEQKCNWEWMEKICEQSNKKNKVLKILNLFAYTGGASLACAKYDHEVVHLDSSKQVVTWAKENAEASGLADKKIRYIVDDVKKFVAKEIKRGNKYDGIILDPPAFGHGPENELWKIEEDFVPLVQDVMKLLSDDPEFVIINGYASGYSSKAFLQNMDYLKKHNGQFEDGELFIQDNFARLLPCGIFSRWKKD